MRYQSCRHQDKLPELQRNNYCGNKSNLHNPYNQPNHHDKEWRITNKKTNTLIKLMLYNH